MRDQLVGEFLERLSARVSAPGGGATAALHAAQSAALLGMVARYSDGPKHAGDADAISAVLSEVDALRVDALRLAEDDAAAFTAVTDAYKLPKGPERSAAIAEALAGAAVPPLRTIAVAERLVALAEVLLPLGNRNVITDVAAAADAARAAATTARVNAEINGAAVESDVDALAARADRVTSRVREEIAK
ncbi:cyclodeaminase/cyclohydrolase family protein [Umezawaea tangerina]|uniref:Formiminotetrahydrofolate cyclodeaminase n=1 Tax=Umezawaea tangerina TaxID=84725 RepID=A0A2T0T4T0_9PSEU|nr:cyclodeaminase/cyclohydrolase family protein [Umezawaea tangerina]PRY40643.1 formiminotetrahydrofolate cyclodeaminase [Umezawaea tangerina]